VDERVAGTFSIIGYDPSTEEWGVAVESKFLAIGAVSPWAKAGVGAVATQSYMNTTFGPRGLELLAQGKSAQEVLDILIESDSGRDFRQVGIVDARGNGANYTGDQCMKWAGGVTGENFAIQGNILVSKATIDAMEETFLKTEGELAFRLMQALIAGQHAGGDARGKQSAALVVVQEGGGYRGFDDMKINLRVDDHPSPITELNRLYLLHKEWSSTRRTDVK